MADAPVTELVLSPRWTATVGNIDGTPHVVLRIQHPRLGPLDFLLPENDAVELAAALEKTWERRDSERLRHGAFQSGGNIETIRPDRPGHGRWWSWPWFRRAGPMVTTKFISVDTAAEKIRSKRSDNESP
jgi:hypothetical protein